MRTITNDYNDSQILNLGSGGERSAAARVDMQGAHTLASMAEELIATGIRFQAVEPRSSVRDRLRHEGVDGKLGGVNRFATVADVIDHFQGERNTSPSQPNNHI